MLNINYITSSIATWLAFNFPSFTLLLLFALFAFEWNNFSQSFMLSSHACMTYKKKGKKKKNPAKNFSFSSCFFLKYGNQINSKQPAPKKRKGFCLLNTQKTQKKNGIRRKRILFCIRDFSFTDEICFAHLPLLLRCLRCACLNYASML